MRGQRFTDRPEVAARPSQGWEVGAAGMRITVSATRSASCSYGSPGSLTVRLGWTTSLGAGAAVRGGTALNSALRGRSGEIWTGGELVSPVSSGSPGEAPCRCSRPFPERWAWLRLLPLTWRAAEKVGLSALPKFEMLLSALYAFLVVRRLDGVGFDLSPEGDQEQRLVENQPATWRWKPPIWSGCARTK